ncbi:type II toxin-antitoxin system PemK/MazF family toxin [Fructobacillus sp. M2-14]|uniref:Type II toxin-antitoxin system PemK/MazF family toxin n=1 Tax=Fructobacillus broussonetiae TaxID=2713173 RepID=A0ABS5QZP9_9LACO|nr:type II toxin-antitoxin system PemK/MazF family toxin [Fructobacillus broussonetiae]MBS9338222.1 type II toxin-antitoxin system PemK/MazF family toxin [Fructobacillus broussonetiae]
MYRPRQGDIIWLDFDPALGIEIKKRRPALVVSSNKFHVITKMVLVVPITSQLRKWKSRFLLNGYQVKGQVNTNQLYSFDLSQRRPIFIQKFKKQDFYQVMDLIHGNFDDSSIHKKKPLGLFLFHLNTLPNKSGTRIIRVI